MGRKAVREAVRKCEGKIILRDFAAARLAMERIALKYKGTVKTSHAYPCRRCGYWHVKSAGRR